jgi:hypothetical protein
MSEREELLARLQELESETEPEEQSILAPGKSQKKPSPFDPLPDDWVPPVVYQSQHEPGSDPATFKIGDWWVDSRTGKKERRQAICHPRFPNPGAVLTKEVDREYWEEWQLWLSASMHLETCIRLTADRLRGTGFNRHVDYWEDSDEKRQLAEHWNFLLGVWQSRGMIPPTTKDLERWVREWK